MTDDRRERGAVSGRGPSLTAWRGADPPTADELTAIFRNEGLAPSWWSNGPGERYAAHSHPYHKVLYCARGTIRFVVRPGANDAEHFDLSSGDRLDLPPGTPHSAVVGPHGVTCVEAATGIIRS